MAGEVRNADVSLGTVSLLENARFSSASFLNTEPLHLVYTRLQYRIVCIGFQSTRVF